ncbi:MAG: alanine racemase [Planctomycetaceae bacterium]|nr:alanine racemase [Planctomycetaceae bacterium]
MKTHLTAEISASTLAYNITSIRRHLEPYVKLCAVVKADAYGHGLELMVPAMLPHADAFAVATAEEAFDVRRVAPRVPLLVFFTPGSIEPGHVELTLAELVRLDVIISIVSAAEVAAVTTAAALAGEQAMVHIKVDTGMGRSGVLPEQFPKLLATVLSHEGIRLQGLYTHLPLADEGDWNYTSMQLDRLRQCAAACPPTMTLCRHAANSAATMGYPSSHLDMVRPGLAIYGYRTGDDCPGQEALRPALRVTARLMQVKDVDAGTRCGYGLTYAMPAAGRIGLVPIGYADGYLRSFSNRACMKVRGQSARVIGRVSMDQTIIDLTGIAGAAVGDEVEVISSDRNEPNSVENLAKMAGTIPYEIIVRLGARVRRVLRD